MFVLNVDLQVKQGSEQALEETYQRVFWPAISSQAGFGRVELLRPLKEDTTYRLSIAFERQELQQKWVATELHEQVWPQIESKCSQCVVKYYALV